MENYPKNYLKTVENYPINYHKAVENYPINYHNAVENYPIFYHKAVDDCSTHSTNPKLKICIDGSDGGTSLYNK